MSKRGFVFMVLGAISTLVVFVSNAAATKLFPLFGFAADCGLLTFPVSYVIGDVMVELYGKKDANKTLKVGFVLNFVAMVMMAIAAWLPTYPGSPTAGAFETVFGFMPRVVVGSLVAWLAAGMVNNAAFEKIKDRTGQWKLYRRVLGSSITARVVDCVLFETIAFAGTLPLYDFLKQVVLAYFAGMAIEVALFPLTKFTVAKIEDYLNSK